MHLRLIKRYLYQTAVLYNKKSEKKEKFNEKNPLVNLLELSKYNTTAKTWNGKSTKRTEILMLSWVFPLPAFVLLLPVAVVVDPLVALTCPNAIAIGLGDESGDDVNEEI